MSKILALRMHGARVNGKASILIKRNFSFSERVNDEKKFTYKIRYRDYEHYLIYYSYFFNHVWRK